MSEKQGIPNEEQEASDGTKRVVLDQLMQQFSGNMYALETRLKVELRLEEMEMGNEQAVEGLKKDMIRQQVGIDIVLEELQALPPIKKEESDEED